MGQSVVALSLPAQSRPPASVIAGPRRTVHSAELGRERGRDLQPGVDPRLGALIPGRAAEPGVARTSAADHVMNLIAADDVFVPE